MSSSGSPGSSGEVRPDGDYDVLKELFEVMELLYPPPSTLPYDYAIMEEKFAQGDQRQYERVNTPFPPNTLLYKLSTCQSEPDQGDQRHNEGDQRHNEGVNTRFPPGSSMLYNLAPSQWDPNQGGQGHSEGVNTVSPPILTLKLKHGQQLEFFLPPDSTLPSNSSTSQSDQDQGHSEGVKISLPPVSTLPSNSSTSQSDQDQRNSEGVKISFPPVSTLPSNSSTSHTDPDQHHAPSSAHPSRARTSSPSTRSTRKRGYTDEQEEAIRSLKKARIKSWVGIAEAYNSRCYPDGTPWEPRTPRALEQRYQDMKRSSKFTSGVNYTQEQEEAICSFRDDDHMTWNEVRKAYNLRCYADGTLWEPRTMGALQQRYRLCQLREAGGEEDGDVDDEA